MTLLFFLWYVTQMKARQNLADLGSVARWAHQWKMSFNSDPSKQAVEVHFSRIITPVDTPPIYFNNLVAASWETQAGF